MFRNIGTTRILIILFCIAVLAEAGGIVWYWQRSARTRGTENAIENTEQDDVSVQDEPVVTEQPIPSQTIETQPVVTQAIVSPPVEKPTKDKVIATSKAYVCEKLGQDFCQKYVRLDPSNISTNADDSLYYFYYTVQIPEKGISSQFHISQSINLSKPIGLELLPNCAIQSECNFLSNTQVEPIVQKEMRKYGIKEDHPILYFEFATLMWYTRFEVAQENITKCTDYMQGGWVEMAIDGRTGRIIRNDFICSSPDI